MKMSQLLAPTLRDDPGDAEIISHKLMVRSGMIRKLAAGIYYYLPLGNRVIKKVENIVREEMNKSGAQEVYLPSLIPAELWRESGRWDLYGKELLRIKDRSDREFCYGPTHEEVITELVRNNVKSYKELPINLYQIQTKFSDEIRPRFGLMRAREFCMKDSYSFHETEESLDITYKKMKETYSSIFSRCGLDFAIVEADVGMMGGSESMEFMVKAPSGEDAIVYCDKCNYSANVEAAKSYPDGYQANISKGHDDNILEIHTPNVKTIEELTSFIKTGPENFIKTLLYEVIYGNDFKVVMALIRCGHEINETKLKNYLKADHLVLAKDEEIKKATGAERGYAGPVGIKNIDIISDVYVMEIKSGFTGANKDNYHLKNVKPNIDFIPKSIVDIRQAKDGDICPKCGKGKYKLARGIEVGHIFKLGLKYSLSMNATFLSKEGEAKPFIMGCYGIGIGRTAQAAVEQSFDENGIIWPAAISPYHADIVVIDVNNKEHIKLAENIYESLWAQNIEAIIDDRDERPGVKFKDADLIGFPLKIILGEKALKNGEVEFKNRKDNKSVLIKKSDVIKRAKEIIFGV